MNIKIRLVQEYPDLYPSLQGLWWQLEVQIWLVFQIPLPPPLQLLANDCNQQTDCWLWLTKQVNTFCRFSWSLKANLAMARDYCHLPDNCANPIHTAPSSCLICHWHWCIVIFPCCSLLFRSCGNVLRKVWNVSDCVQRQRFLEFYKLFHVFCWNPYKKTVVKSL